jgi:hypothetical protein
METVKVDTQKLQLLNDRIAQTIDALNQLKMSVHGIQHSPVSPYYANPYYQQYAQQAAAFAPQFSPFAQPFVPPYAATPGFIGAPGIQHTTTLSPLRGWTTLPTYAQTLPQYAQTYGQTIPTYAQTFGQTLGNTFGNGISHTEWDPTFTTRQWTTPQWPFPMS